MYMYIGPTVSFKHFYTEQFAFYQIFPSRRSACTLVDILQIIIFEDDAKSLLPPRSRS